MNNYGEYLEEVITVDKGKRDIEMYIQAIKVFMETGTVTMTPKMFMQAYTSVNRMCDELDKGADLYMYYQEILKGYLDENASWLRQNQAKSDSEYLESYTRLWSKYSLLVMAINKIFNYLDRYFLKNQRNLSLTDKALDIFREHVFLREVVKLRNSIYSLITREREDELVDLDLVKMGIQQFVYMGFEQKTLLRKIDGTKELIHWVGEKNLKIYDQQFEADLLTYTRDFYSKKA